MGVVEGIGTSATATGGRRTPLSQRIEAAQTKAVRNALDEGVRISDTEELLRRKDMARRSVIATSEQEGG